jgi:hypothetical protein
MSYTPKQLALANTIVRVGRRMGASRKQIKSALETALVEANLSNPSGGDGTSKGWRQETASSYPNVNRMDVTGSARRYFKEVKGADRPGLSSGALAQSVQRSAYPDRYDQRGREAGRLLRRLGGGGGPSATINPPAGSGPQAAGDPHAALVQALLSGRSVGRPLTEARHIQAAQPPNPNVPDTHRSKGGPHLYGDDEAGGRVTVAAGADRPGVKTDKAVIGFVRRVSGILGEPLQIGTGSRHTRMTVNGNVSAHWTGHAADVPLRGKALIRAGQAALIAAGMPAARARRITGGLINYGGWQIIFNTHEGGDHTNHLHVGKRG